MPTKTTTKKTVTATRTTKRNPLKKLDLVPEVQNKPKEHLRQFRFGPLLASIIIGKDGNPTRFALTARSLRDSAPKTLAAAKRLGDKGRKLIERALNSSRARAKE